MKRVGLIIAFLVFSLTLLATHNRAGEITYRQIDELTYEITLVTYTYTPSAANETRDYLDISWGDNTSSLIPRISVNYLPDDYQKNVYKMQHSYPGPGIYRIVMEDPNRNEGVDNIPGSVNVIFSIATTLKIDATVGFNTTPVLLNPPLDKAVVGQTFIHNPSAYDAEGDSISYELTICRQENGDEIPDYTFPPSSNDFYVDAITGDLVWDAPIQVGSYNVAMLIEEWRDGIKIGQIIRDMQIEVQNGNNQKPQIQPVQDYCVEAGQNINYSVVADEPDGNFVTVEATGGPLETLPAATFSVITEGYGQSAYMFDWNTECSNVRYMPYQMVYKATDSGKTPILVDFKSNYITVVSPAPENLLLTPTFNSIALQWDPVICSQAMGYDVYRKISPSGWNPSSCETGIPISVGFENIGRLYGISNCTFIDNNEGQGLEQGFEYCYRVVAWFDDGAESYASEEVCTELELGYPLITKVSVATTDENNGKIDLSWAKYLDFDTVALPGPYVFLIYRSEDIIGQNLVLIDSTLSINDTTYLDSLLNTVDNIYSYSVEMYNNTPGNRLLIGTPQLASSSFLKAYPGDNSVTLKLKRSTPWLNDTMVVYRMNYNASVYDSVGFTLTTNYKDLNLENGLMYCYKILSIGHYPPQEYSKTLYNWSQETCVTPIDTIPPCKPNLRLESSCDEYYNTIEWHVVDSCKADISYFNIYYSPTTEGEMQILQTLIPASDSVYLHYPDYSIAGCYSLTAVDSFANESANTQRYCIDNCTYYELPNVFSPNGDNINDLVIPGPYKFVEKVDMKIYNRWGTLVFETEDPDIKWDGRFMENGKLLNAGVYYYSCDVYERRLSGIEVRNLTGFFQLNNPTENATNE
ncbi:MAG: gliding motility-associated C-terminal domain-containing protein [Bacteroidales bacterium]|nr:gliding motility-associated C-terminal domain-containing protein [Bacteroidales bacterium]